MSEEPKHVGCPYCVRGHMPTWQWTPEPGEFVHVIQEKSADQKTTIDSWAHEND